MSSKILINNASGSDFTSEPYESRGGVAVINVRGTFGPATVILQVATVNDPDTRWLSLDEGILQVQATVKLDYLPQGLMVRAMLTGTDGTTEDMFVDIIQ